jgi:hypothetical protein
MATRKPWELQYDSTTIEQVQAAPVGAAVQGQRPWEMSYSLAPEQAPSTVPTQRIRAMGQGLTLGAADEIEAYLRGLTGEDREAALAEIRAKLGAYRQDRPMESLGYELLGSTPTSAATFGLSRSIPALQRVPEVGRIALGGAGTGGVTGFFGSEREGVERLRDVPVGTAIGAVAGPGAYYGVKAGGAVVDGVMDFARRAMGGRGAKAVETELQRLAKESGLTNEEIVQRIARGEIMAENETLRAAVRGYYTQGGEAATTIGRSLTERPNILRQRFMGQLQEGMTEGMPGNVLRQVRMDDDAIRTAERAMYRGAFEQGGVVTEPLLKNFTAAMQRSPKAANEIAEYYQAQSGQRPFFTVKPDGNIEFSRTPNLQDMEIVRRGLQEQVDVAFRGGKGGTGEAFKDLERALRAELDKASPALAGARAQAATVRTARDAFNEGRKALSKSADEVELMFSGMNENQIRSYRAGLMDALRARATTGSRNTMVRNIADPNTKEGQILRTVFPGDQLDSMLELAGVASRSQQAATTIMGGSSTAANLAQQSRIGSTISAEEMLSFGVNPVSTIRTTGKIIDMLTPNLSEAQRNRVAQILVSEDPNLVRNALADNSLMAQLQQRVQSIVQGLAVGAAGAASYTPARLGQQ